MTDDGYYEFTIRAGAAYFFGTAVTVTYNETPSVMALYPVGGTTPETPVRHRHTCLKMVLLK